MCRHTQTKSSEARAYQGQVAVEPYTDVNRAAHGNIAVTETCRTCGAEREVLINGRHYEYGPWIEADG